MATKNDVDSWLLILAISLGLAFWQVTIVLICITLIVATKLFLQGQAHWPKQIDG